MEENFNTFIKGKTTASDVLRQCGTPSLLLDNYTWIYVGYKIKENTFKNAELVYEFAVRLIFDHNGILKSIEPIDPKSKTNVVMNKEITNLISDAQADLKIKKILSKNNS